MPAQECILKKLIISACLLACGAVSAAPSLSTPPLAPPTTLASKSKVASAQDELARTLATLFTPVHHSAHTPAASASVSASPALAELPSAFPGWSVAQGTPSWDLARSEPSTVLALKDVPAQDATMEAALEPLLDPLNASLNAPVDWTETFFATASLTSTLPKIDARAPLKPAVKAPYSASYDPSAATALFSAPDYMRYMQTKFKVSPELSRRIVSSAYSEAKQVGVSPQLLLAIMERESGFQPNAKSSVGAVGLMQVMGKYHAHKLGTPNVDLTHPETNIKLGAKVLQEYVKLAGGNLQRALKNYSGGARNYANKVLGTYQSLKELVTSQSESKR